MDNVHSLRNQYMADIVVLLVDDNQYCGVATLLAQQTTAFAVVNYQCATTNITFAHEIGHLMGAQHDPFVNDDNPHFDYGYGYVDPNNQWRTIMAYGNACNNCARIPYWSNPNVNHPITNQPMGTSSEHNNARVLNITQYDVRDFRTLSPPQSFIITNRYSYNQSPHFTWIEHPQADYHRVYRCLTTSGTYPPSCFMLVGGGDR